MTFEDHMRNKIRGEDVKGYKKPMGAIDFINQSRNSSPVQQPQPQQQQTAGLSTNPLSPTSLDEYVGQVEMKRRLRMMINGARRKNKRLIHILLAAGAGKGKSTLAEIIAAEMGVQCYAVQAPVDRDDLIDLGFKMNDGDILLIDECHLQSKGKNAHNNEEVLYGIMQGRYIETDQGRKQYPDVTVIGATTDRGLLKRPFLQRFKYKPPFEDYTEDDMFEIVMMNGDQLKVEITDDAAHIFAKASTGTPRVINGFVEQADAVMDGFGETEVNKFIATEVLRNEQVEDDGLTRDQMIYLEGLWERKRWVKASQMWEAKASLATMAHVTDCARDTEYVKQEIEPMLFKRNYIEVVPGGRRLTEHAVERLGVTWPPDPQTKGERG